MRGGGAAGELSRWLVRFTPAYASGIGTLALGFASTIVLPRLVIRDGGVETWGVTVLLLAYGVVASYGDLGLTSGVTRRFGVLAAAGKTAEAAEVVRLFARKTAAIGLLLAAAAAVAAAVWLQVPLSPTRVLLATFAGGLANVLAFLTELWLVPMRIGERFGRANGIKGAYYGLLVGVAVGMSLVRPLPPDAVPWLQLGAAAVTAWIAWRAGGLKGAGRPDRTAGAGRHPEVWSVSVPDQIGRVQSAGWPPLERTLLLGTGGLAFAANFDLVNRLTLAVSTLPMIVASPMLSVLTVRLARGNEREARREANLATLVNCALAVASGLAVLGLSLGYGAQLFGAKDLGPVELRTWMILGTALNVVSAVPNAAYVAGGRMAVPTAKAAADAAAALAGGALALVTSSALWYARVRFGGMGVAGLVVLGFWLFERRGARNGAGAA